MKTGAIMFDIKRDYAFLIKYWSEVLVFPYGEFLINPLMPPPGVNPALWLETFVSLFSLLDTRISTQGLLLEILSKIYEERDIYNGGDDYPDMYLLNDQIQKMKIPNDRKRADYLGTLKERFSAMMSNRNTAKQFDCKSGVPIHEILDRMTVIIVDGRLSALRNIIGRTFDIPV